MAIGNAGAAARPMNAVARVPGSGGKRRILNHDISSFARSTDPLMRLYSARALGLSNPEDTIQLAPELRGEWAAIARHYDRIGLMHSRDVIWDTNYSWIIQLAGQEISVQFFDEQAQRHRDDRKWCEVVRYIGSKNNFIQLAGELKVDVPRTWRFDRRRDIKDVGTFPYPCYLKASVPTYDGGIYRCASSAALNDALTHFEPLVPLQVQEELTSDCFLTLHYTVVDDIATRVAVTEKRRADHVHQDTRFPSAHAPWHVVQPMATWLAAVGLRGVFDFEVAVVMDGDRPRYLPIGCRPWYSDSAYAVLIAQQLGLDEWCAIQVDSRRRRLGEIDLTGIEYSDFIGAGVVIINWGVILAGKLGVILAGPEQMQHQLKVELERRLW
ncbi:MAG: Uncharacterized protein FD165_1956 [Gammaproteobacteria bacterium]|nr:MAG: Uncharacterized protein FD165_1956 [Gammaproteobacteria bacterium]TND04949.1 MAG: Uncharacterized protein FD120_1227 [Gammaproteobacteria bacterium]